MEEGSPEWIALEERIKPALRCIESEPRLPALWDWFASRGVAGARGATLRGRSPRVLVYFAHRLDVARELAEVERSLHEAPPWRIGRRHHRAAVERIGTLLGYPPCCVGVFVDGLNLRRAVLERFVDESYLSARRAAARTKQPRACLNDLLPFDGEPRLIPFVPCRYDCPAAADYATRVFEAVARRAPDGALPWKKRLMCRAAILPDNSRVVDPTSTSRGMVVVDFRSAF